ncbi:hypothetical protein [Ralstonia sp. 24A2]|uniref:hypothetical protein n=1 Tax=Ralstonia sp. 24A2 TaxID=3447364 RepID=UPI003F695734
MQVTTQRFAVRTLAVAAGSLALVLGAGVAHAGSIDPYQPAHKISRADPYTDGAKMGRADPYTDGARMGQRDPYTDGACADGKPQGSGT